MRLGVVGGTGRTGTRLVEVAIERGHTVRALARKPPPAVPDERGALTWIRGDVLDPSAVAQFASGCEAMIVALGPGPESPPDLCRRGTATVISACRAFRIRRLVVLTGAMIGHPRERLAMVLRTLWRTYTVVRASSAADRRAQEALVIDSDLDWTLVRPPRLIEGEPTEGVVAGSELFVPARAQATIGDVVDVMLDAIERDMWVRSGVTVLSDAEAATDPDLSQDPFSRVPIPVEVQWDLDGEDFDGDADSDGDDPTLRDARPAPPDAAPPTDGGAGGDGDEDHEDWDLAPDLDSDDRSAGG